MDRFMKVVNRLLWVIFLGMGTYLLAAGSSRFWTGSVQELLVKGKGAPHMKGNGSGDLRIHLIITLPEKLNDEQRKAMEDYLAATKEDVRVWQ